MEILSILLTVVLIAISILIVLIVLLQRPKQEGLGAAFGGSTLDGALGAQTTDVLQKATTVFGVIFFVCSISLAIIKTRQFQNQGDEALLDGVGTQAIEAPADPAGTTISPPIDPAAPIPVGIPAPAEGQPAVDPAKGDASKAPAKSAEKADAAPAPAESKPAPAEKAKSAPKNAGKKAEAPAKGGEKAKGGKKGE